MSTIEANKRIFLFIFAITFIVSSLFFVLQSSKTAGGPQASAEDLGYSITDSDAKSYNVDALVSAEIEKIIAHVEEIERQKQQEIQQSSARNSQIRTAPNYDPGDGSRWDQLAQCEAGGNWATNTGNGFGGGLQFMHQSGYSTWLSFGGGEFAPHPWEATREQQIVIAEKVLASSGWNAWPGCSRKFGWL